MPWDIFIQDFPDVSTVSEIPKNFKPKPLGKRKELIKKIKEILPRADFSDPSWGTYEDKKIDIEFNMGDDEVCESIALHIRGDIGVHDLLDKVLKHLKFKALDSTTGVFFENK